MTTTNALMKEDLAIARNSLLALQAENQALRQSINRNCKGTLFTVSAKECLVLSEIINLESVYFVKLFSKFQLNFDSDLWKTK